MDRLETLLDHLSQEPTESFLYFAIAKEYEARNQIGKAIDYYVKLRELNPDYIGLYYHLGHAYEEIEHSKEAVKTYNDGIVVAKRLADMHSLAELQNAKQNLEISEI